jgi:hypothetical protein
MLGRDRFCNRYWWFEHNGIRKHEYKIGEKATEQAQVKHEMNVVNDDKAYDDNEETANDQEPVDTMQDQSGDENADDDESQQAQEEEEHTTNYSMGRLWIQGPSEDDFKMFLDPPGYVPSPSPLERKKLAEGESFLRGSQDWAYYDDVAEIESLLAFLNPRGKREFRLLNELRTSRNEIIASLNERHKDIAVSERARQHELEAALEDAVADKNDGGADDSDTGDEIITSRRRSGRAPRITDDTETGDELIPSRRRSGGVRRRGRPPRKPVVKTRSEVKNEIESLPTPRVRWWSNDLAIENLGHSHYESFRKRGPKRGRNH